MARLGSCRQVDLFINQYVPLLLTKAAEFSVVCIDAGIKCQVTKDF